MDLVASALAYAARNWHIFPLHGIVDHHCTCGNPACRHPGKHPRTAKGFKSSSTERDVVERWWRKWPDANIGLDLGKSGLAVIDVDGPEGLKELQALVGQHAGLPPTLAARTGRGFHLYYRGTNVKSRKLGKHLDLKATGGYVVLAPSNHASGVAYTWVDETTPIAELPQWIRAASVKHQAHSSAHAPASVKHLGRNQNKTGFENPSWLANRPAWVDDLPPGPDPADNILRAAQPSYSPQEANKLRSALASLDPDMSEPDWVGVGMALAELRWLDQEGNDFGLVLWDEWSAKGKKYKGLSELEAKWNNFHREYSGLKVTVASIYRKALDAGWTGAELKPVNNINGIPAAAQVFPQAVNVSTTDQRLILLNQKHAVINNIGGKCMVLEWTKSPIKNMGLVPSFQSFTAFKERYSNQYMASVGRRRRPDTLGEYWLGWTDRTTFEGLELSPKGTTEGFLNLWRGFGVEPKEGDWSKLKWHIRHILGCDHAPAYHYIFKWAAWAVQNPDQPAQAALVLQGDDSGEGAGKGTFAYAMRRIFGWHAVHATDSKHLIGFNKILMGCILLFADEAFWAGDKKGEPVLKRLITENTIEIEPKGMDVMIVPNLLHIIIATNSEWAVPAGRDARRYAVWKVSNEKCRDKAYFDALYDEMENGGIAAFLHDLLHFELEGWHPAQIPFSDALQEQKELSMDWRWAWLNEILQAGQIPFSSSLPSDFKGKNLCTAEAIFTNVKDLFGVSWYGRQITQNALGRFLRKQAGCILHHMEIGNYWEFPDLKIMRERFSTRMGKWRWENEKIQKWNEKGKND